MQEIWTYIESWLYANAPKILDTLQPGASDTQIKAAEDFLSIQFPAQVKASYRIHNGQDYNYGFDYGYGFLDGKDFLSLEDMQEQWAVWKELLDDGEFEGVESSPDAGIRSDWWSPQWIPLTHDRTGDHHCLDLNPGEGGKCGQIITMWHDESERQIVAPSFREWLEQYAEGLKLGQFVFSEEHRGIVNVDDM